MSSWIATARSSLPVAGEVSLHHPIRVESSDVIIDGGLEGAIAVAHQDLDETLLFREGHVEPAVAVEVTRHDRDRVAPDLRHDTRPF